MRGLDERIRLAQARILQVIYPDNVDFGEVAYDAHALGMRDYSAGLTEPPVMFMNEPLLLRAWTDGQAFMSGLEEMASCEGCQDASLPMCPTHG